MSASNVYTVALHVPVSHEDQTSMCLHNYYERMHMPDKIHFGVEATTFERTL